VLRPLPFLAILLASAGLAGCADQAASGDEGPDFSDLGLAASATTGLIRGIAVDQAIRPLADAAVTLTPGDLVTRTTANGTFGFDGLAAGSYFLHVEKFGYTAAQSSAEVVAGEAEPPIVRILLQVVPSLQPYVEALQYNGFMAVGAAIGITSVGSTTFQGTLGEDVTIWTVNFTQVPTWAQGELMWTHNQPAGGMLIWEMVVGGTNDFKGYRETAESPALAYWNATTLQAEADNVTGPGIAYRYFGGAHPLLAPNSAGGTIFPPEDQCPVIPTVVLGDRNPCRFGFGLTTQQTADAYIHHFFNFAPREGWRFTVDGAPEIPPM
jgi:hypothetical protein